MFSLPRPFLALLGVVDAMSGQVGSHGSAALDADWDWGQQTTSEGCLSKNNLPGLSADAMKVLAVLEEHPRLGRLQVAALAMLAPTAAHAALQELAEADLLAEAVERYVLDRDALEAAVIDATA